MSETRNDARQSIAQHIIINIAPLMLPFLPGLVIAAGTKPVREMFAAQDNLQWGVASGAQSLTEGVHVPDDRARLPQLPPQIHSSSRRQLRRSASMTEDRLGRPKYRLTLAISWLGFHPARLHLLG
jgi:hypothetical protein